MSILTSAITSLESSVRVLLTAAPFFILLALLLKGRGAVSDARRAIRETRINLQLLFVDVLLVAPLLAVISEAMARALWDAGLVLVAPETWTSLPPIVVSIVAIIAGDFIAYWRHRLEHTRLLWPAHSIHHSDTEMTWLALFRFHPINRLSTVALDSAFLLILGLPPYALIVNVAVRHWYGMFIHADLPWTYGAFRYLFVSPVMHRWHHAKDPQAFNTNYATIFCVFDLLFGTYRVPGPCTAPLGVSNDFGVRRLRDFLAHPFLRSSYSLGPQPNETEDTKLAQRNDQTRLLVGAEPREDVFQR